MTASENTAMPAVEQPVALVMAAIATVLFLGSLSQTSVSTALPVIVGDLGGLDHLTWVITAYLLASTVGAPIYGKLGDLYGRKIIIQSAIGVFLIGSIIAGVAADMMMMVAGRLVQGLGGGGLMVVSMTVVADVLPARERGKAQGLLAGVFGISTILGPLMGGFFVDHLSWHWIFFVNLPIGLVALGVITMALKPLGRRVKHKIDYAGAMMLAGFLASTVLFTSLGGTSFAWNSPVILGLMALSVVCLAGFIFAERRAAEPVLPLSLFRNNNFVVSNGVGLITGLAMFGAITFMPLYLQVVKGISPSTSGLLLLPMMGGLIAASTISGQIMSRTGRYRILPIVASVIMFSGLSLLATLTPDTEIWQVSVYMLIVGLGIGPMMSIGVTAIQNAVAPEMLGVATASAALFRQVGGSLGVSAFGAIFAGGLAVQLGNLQGGEALGAGRSSLSPGLVASLPEPLRHTVLEGVTAALHPVFLCAAVASVMAFALSFLLREIPLSNTLPGRDAA
ncbi:MDR family MFS transporter [Cucumibacter marinus]|uniref:MDR family MFS transporter n=1 Tax=Cucumibacter marinus TaxID=1121252 RepID=UPI000401E773|nr:MDR family MFS transporter [Cucumibacter marinus]